jgi:hypothetical protein
MRLARDDVDGALGDAARGLELTRKAEDPQNVYVVLSRAASIYLEAGRPDLAEPLVDEMIEVLAAGREIAYGVSALHILAWPASRLGRGDELVAALANYKGHWVDAAAALARGDVLGAADLCEGMGAVMEEAFDRLAAAERLVAEGSRGDADVQLERALAFFRSVGASRYVRRGETLLAASA